MSSSTPTSSRTTPRIILHGGAGNISHANLPPTSRTAYRVSLLRILRSSSSLLSVPGATALDVATHAVALLEDEPLFNAGCGAVFTRAGTNELEASVMVSDGLRKRGVGVMLLKHVKNPVKLAREMLLRGEEAGGGGAGGHAQLSGEALEELGRGWGVEMVEPGYFWTRRRWEEHLRGLEREKGGAEGIAEPVGAVEDGGPSWDGKEYLPQGTVGAVVLDSFGTLCVATSTGGLTNKLPGRIGDTPTLGAGFWAEEWFTNEELSTPRMVYQPQTPMDKLSRGDISGLLSDCLPLSLASNTELSLRPLRIESADDKPKKIRHAIAVSGTGNGDAFLRLSACRTVGAISRFASSPLSSAMTQIVGPGGELQRSAGDRWGKTGEGEGGMIGIEVANGKGRVVMNFNCGGMFRAWVDDDGKERFGVFKGEDD